MKRSLQAIALAVALVAAAPAMAHSEVAPSPSTPEMSLDAQARAQVDNDLMTVVLTVDVEGQRVQELTQRALAALQRASVKAKEKPGIDVVVGSVNTNPVWGPKGRTNNWQVRGHITLSSTNVAALGLLASELTASDLQIQGVNFSLSRAKRDEVEAKLMTEAAAAFKRKAQVMTSALGFKGYTIRMVGLSQEGGHMPPPHAPMMMKGAMAMAEAAVPIPTEGGKTEVVLTMSGTVELK